MRIYIIASLCAVGVFFLVVGISGWENYNRELFDFEERLLLGAGSAILTLGGLLLKYR